MGNTALVPARGGSRRVPRKNVREFHGIPTISRVIQTLHDTGLFDEIVVSTDDDEVASVALEAGAEVPFRRPLELADDRTGARPVIQHAIQQLDLPVDEAVAVVYPTAVLLGPQDVLAARELLSPDVDFVLTVAEFPAPISRALTLNSEGIVGEVSSADTYTRTQDLERTYHDVGQMYWGSVEAWQGVTPVVRARTRAFILPAWRAIDIDTIEDWEHAERIFELVARDK